jgi:hypothetical protein
MSLEKEKIMACSSCGKKAKVSVDATQVQTKQTLFDTGVFLPVVYTNYGTSTRVVGSPTGVITEFGLTSYGQAKPGDVLLVHKKDVEKTPQIFVLLQKSSNKYKDALKKFGIVENVVALEIGKAVVAGITQAFVVEEPVVEVITEAMLDEVVEPVVVMPSAAVTPSSDNATMKLLKRSEALAMPDFMEQYGYTHHLAVHAKIRSGELKSYKNDKVTYVYHYEGDE